MATVAPGLVVEGPEPELQRFGLFSIAATHTPESPRFQSGVTWESRAACEPANAYGSECDETTGYPLELREGQDVVNGTPFGVYGTYRCKLFSKPFEMARTRALDDLLAWEERSVERAIMHGDLGNVPSFQGATVLGVGAVSAPQGLDLLEEWIAQNLPSTGVIHVPRSLSGTMGVGGGWVVRVGEHVEIELTGTLVAIGGGYDMPNVSPAGVVAPAGSRWVYATSRPVVRRSDVFFTPDEEHGINHENNDVNVIAHRTYVIGWDCEVAAVQITQGQE